uniref:Alpha-protein kinase 2 n=1 Tax=Tursiops truncatus TaxID=9739 RepID=A0A6J3PUL3_TURTR|nr:alpha-protein kinase 2 isoform X2 [Tursiops truncatus]
MRQTEEARDPDNTEDVAEGLLCSNSSNIPDKQDVCGHRTVHSELSRLMDGALDTNGPNEEVFNSSHQNPTVQKSISFSLPLMEVASSTSPGDRATGNKTVSCPASSTDFDSDYELCSEITLTYAEEFSDNDLEYLECSDVMTDHSNAIWQRDLQGTERVFLLESDDEEMEFSECCLGGCEHFLSEMGCEPLVSDDTGPMDATAGLCGHHSPSQEVEVRSSLASMHSASSPQTGMTLPVGPHQDGTSVVTDQGRYKPPTAPEAAEDGYPGIQGETRDGHQAGKEFASDNLLNMDKAVTERERKHLSGELGKSGMNQCLETVAEKRVGGKGLLSRRGSEKPARARRPGIKGKAKKLNPNLEEGATEAPLNRLYPRGPVKHPLTPSDKRESSHAKAEATGLNSQLHAGGCATPTQAEQEANILQTPPGSLSKEGSLDLQGEGVWVKNVLETSRIPDWSDHLQVQIQETVREQISLSRMPAFSEPTGEESAFTMTTIDSFSNLGGIDTKNASLAQHLEVERCTQGPRHEDNQDGEDSTPGCPWGDLGCELSIPEANSENMPRCEPSARLPQENSADPGEPRAPSLASPEFVRTVPTLETACAGPRDRVTACVLGRPEAGDQEACDTVSSPVGAPAGKYLPQEICSVDFELAGQSKASDLCSSDDKALDILSQTQGSEPAQSTYGSSNERTSAVFPLFISALIWNISQKASKGATGENLCKVEGSTSMLASMVKAGQGGLSPSHSGGLEERQPLSSENDSLEWSKEGGDESSSSSAPVTADTPASHSSTAKFPQEKPTTLIANLECFEVTGESGDTSTVTIATKGQPPKYLPVSVAGNSHVGGPDESSTRAPDDNFSQLPSNAQLGHILNGSTTASSKGLACVAPSGPGIHAHVPQLPEGEDFCSNSLLQIDNQSGKNQNVGRADTRSLEENFQEKGSETTQSVQQGSLDENFQESLPMTSAVPGEINLVLSDHSSANSREGREQSSGLGTRVPMVAESITEDDSQALSNVPSPSNTLLGEPKESGPGYWEAGKRVKIITLEASISETWPPRQLTDSKCKESEPGLIPGRVWAVSDVLKTDAAVPELDPSETASACSPQAESGSAIANNGEIHKGEDLAGHANWSCLSSQCLSQPRLLESSVDPVDEKELCVTDLLSEASRTGRKQKENVKSVSQNQEESQLKMDRPSFFKQFLTCPEILESSVDPTDETSVEWARVETPEPSESTLGAVRVESKLNDGNLGQRVEVQPSIFQVPCPQQSGEAIPRENTVSRDQGHSGGEGARQSQRDGAKGDVRSAILPVPGPVKGGETTPTGRSRSQIREGSERRLAEAEQSKNNKAEFVSPTLPLSSGLARMTPASGVDTHGSTSQSHDLPENDLVEPRNHQCAFSDLKERGAIESECGKHVPPSSGLTWGLFTSSLEESITGFSRSHKIEEHKIEEPPVGETKPTSTSGSPAATLMSRECASKKVPKMLQDPCQQGSTLGRGKMSREEKVLPVVAQAGCLPRVPPAVTGSEEVKGKQETSGSGHIAEGVKKKILSRVATLRLRLEEKENARKNSIFLKKSPELETSVSRTDEKKDSKRPPCKSEGTAPVLLKKIQAEMFPDHSGNVKLSCQFAEIHEDSTIWWMKDSKSIAQVQRRAGDSSTVSLAILQASQKDQGLYSCCIKNGYGKVATEFHLTTEVYEEIEFSQLIFGGDFLSDSYFGGRLRGQIATEELHFGEGVHRKAFRSKVMQGLTPVFKPGHTCVLKVHNAVAYGTRNNDELIQRNYKLAAQECYVQNTARYYAKIYAAEAQPLEGFGDVPEIIPIFLIHRPENNIPYATVEEELIGEFVKYSIRDGKEINFLRRESEAGQKCCTFQHWVYQKTSGCLLVTDMQGVGMKLTDVGIATLAKGYKGFKGNCSMTFIDQFKALHQCNKYCKMLGLKSLQNSQKQKKPSIGKSKIQPNCTTVRKTASGTPAGKKT